MRATPRLLTASLLSFASAAVGVTHSGVAACPVVSSSMNSLASPALRMMRRARSTACCHRLLPSPARAAMEIELSSTNTRRWATPPTAGACGRVSASVMLSPMTSASSNDSHQRQRSVAGRCADSILRQMKLDDATVTRRSLGLSPYSSTISNVTPASKA